MRELEIQVPDVAYEAAETAGMLHGSIRSAVEAAAPHIVAANQVKPHPSRLGQGVASAVVLTAASGVVAVLVAVAVRVVRWVL